MNRRRAFGTVLAAFLFLVTLGCDPGTPAAPPVNSPPVAQAPAPAGGDTSPHSVPSLGPATSRNSAPPAPLAAVGPAINAPGATFDLPANWAQEEPGSSMRLAQATIPGSGGPGQLTVFYFGPNGGGPIEDNLQRWIGQMEVAPGKTPQRGTFALEQFRVSWVEVEGTLLPSTMGVGPTTPQPNSRLLGAVVEGAQGPWFFKATGPDKTMVEQKDAFLGMVRSARPNL